MSFILATPGQGSQITPVVEKPMSAPLTYNEQQGALLIDDGTGNWSVCGADPVLIGAVAATSGGPDTTSLAGVGGFNIRGRREIPTGTIGGYLVQNNERFRAKYFGTPPTNPLGQLFGVIRDPADGLWKVDFTETVNTRLKIVGYQNVSPENQPYVIVEFLLANVQQN